MNAINQINPLKPDTLIKNLTNKPVVSSVRVNADAQRVWEVVGDFGGFGKFIPALESINVTGSGTGSVRHKAFKDGNVVIEQLNSRDDQAMSMTWTLIHNSLGIGNLWAAMTVVPINDTHCVATWSIIGEPGKGNPVKPEDFRNFLQGFADDAMNNVRNLFV